jgi:AraC-like DNA-binding protein
MAEDANAADQKLVDTLMRLMADERIYRHDNITIGTLAAKLGIPEYRLRRLINQRLGYRNFNVFLNNHRIEEVKAALADPSQAEVPVITIAMDAASSRSVRSIALSRRPLASRRANIAVSTRRRLDP